MVFFNNIDSVLYQVDEGLNDVHGRTNVAGGRTPRATPSSAPMP